MPIKSFRGRIEDGQIETIALHTNNGSIGYQIKKFECMTDGFGNSEMVIKIFSVPQTSTSNTIDFSDNTLLAACMISSSSSDEANTEDRVIVFDNVTFNQDIHITAAVSSSSDKINYHLELEQIKLDLTENTVATLKDIKNIEQSRQ
tara:strand:+ start:22 stop:462 length:441 start_codon:yes stop_codon:yes gene_type:complete